MVDVGSARYWLDWYHCPCVCPLPKALLMSLVPTAIISCGEAAGGGLALFVEGFLTVDAPVTEK